MEDLETFGFINCLISSSLPLSLEVLRETIGRPSSLSLERAQLNRI